MRASTARTCWSSPRPCFFSQLSGPLLSLLSRLQCRYLDRALRSAPPRNALGVVLLAAGGAGSVEPALAGAKSVFAALGIRFLGYALAGHTDLIPAARDNDALAQARTLGLLAREEALASSS